MMYELGLVAKMVQSAIEENLDKRRRPFRQQARFYLLRRLFARVLFKAGSAVWLAVAKVLIRRHIRPPSIGSGTTLPSVRGGHMYDSNDLSARTGLSAATISRYLQRRESYGAAEQAASCF